MDGVKIGFRNLWGQVAMTLVLLSSMGGCTEEETSAGSRNMVFRLSLPGSVGGEHTGRRNAERGDD